MAKFTPLDAILPSRVVGRTAGTQIWIMPWACRACQRMGTIQVNTAIGQRTSDGEVQSMLDRDHYQKSRLCHLSPFHRPPVPQGARWGEDLPSGEGRNAGDVHAGTVAAMEREGRFLTPFTV